MVALGVAGLWHLMASLFGWDMSLGRGSSRLGLLVNLFDLLVVTPLWAWVVWLMWVTPAQCGRWLGLWLLACAAFDLYGLYHDLARLKRRDPVAYAVADADIVMFLAHALLLATAGVLCLRLGGRRAGTAAAAGAPPGAS